LYKLWVAVSSGGGWMKVGTISFAHSFFFI
jgi:hypothetical protein